MTDSLANALSASTRDGASPWLSTPSSLVGHNGALAIYWNGVMARQDSGEWLFSEGGARPGRDRPFDEIAPDERPLFSDLTIVAMRALPPSRGASTATRSRCGTRIGLTSTPKGAPIGLDADLFRPRHRFRRSEAGPRATRPPCQPTAISLRRKYHHQSQTSSPKVLPLAGNLSAPTADCVNHP
jgi:hypothetical protein